MIHSTPFFTDRNTILAYGKVIFIFDLNTPLFIQVNERSNAVAGYVEGNTATVKDCSAKGCSVTASNNSSVDANLFGYNNGGIFEGNADISGNTLKYGK